MKKLDFMVILFTISFSLLLIGCNPTDPPIEMFTVTTEIVGNGTVDPMIKTVEKGGSVTFSIAPQDGFELVSLKIDGVNVAIRNLSKVYTIKSVSSNHKACFEFDKKEQNGFTIILGKNGTISSCNQITGLGTTVLGLWTYEGEKVTFTVKPSDGFVVDTFMVGGVMKTLLSDNTYTTVIDPWYIKMPKIYITFKLDIKYGSPEWILTQDKWNCDSTFDYVKNEVYPEGVWVHHPFPRKWVYTFLETGVVVKDFNDDFNDNYIVSYDWKYNNETLNISGSVFDLGIINKDVFIMGKKNDHFLYFTKIK